MREDQNTSGRYAVLHRVIESGDATDVTLQKMVEVCVHMGKKD